MKKTDPDYPRARELLRAEKWGSGKWIVLDYTKMGHAIEILVYGHVSDRVHNPGYFHVEIRLAIFMGDRDTAMASLIVDQLWRKANVPRSRKASRRG